MNPDNSLLPYIGTMGFSYKDWNGVFYPAGMDSVDYLAYYSRIFNSVEIDSTFYGTPRKTTVQHWAAATPTGFKFSLKAPRAITHDLALVGAWGLMAEFLDAARLFGDRLGVILLQFPPSFKVSVMQTLARFLALLPKDLRFAVEVRDHSWHTAEMEFETLLKENSVAWAATQFPYLPEKLHPTADFLYIRWIGRHGSFHQHASERIERTPDLQRWWAQIQANSDAVRDIFGYFNNDYAGFAAGTALKCKALLGQPVDIPRPPRQDVLF